MGRIVLTCGHDLAPDMELEDTEVAYRSESCDPVDGFQRVVVHANFCPDCQKQDWFLEDRILTEAEGDEWLDGGRNGTEAA